MRVLLVEDEKKIATALKKGLEQEAFAVDLAFGGDDGFSLALTQPYDLVILDRMLPGRHDGTEILKEMRLKGINAPVIFLTAKDKIGDRVEGLNLGADDYLVKPFAFEELLARMRALLRRPKENLGPILKYQNLTLDSGNRAAQRDGRELNLTATEFALLEYMMRNSEKVLSKDEIISRVWDYDADILWNTVEVYIGYLRKKVDRPFSGPPLIHTKRGFGYYLGVKRDV
ncbi:MAG: response regulator transcription factor [Actinomycetota bacterium]|nr:response regulator transcription factor [Actinomycetota bacterium]